MSGDIQHVSVNLAARSYQITIGTGILSQLAERLTELRPVSRAVVITDRNVLVHASRCAESLADWGIDVELLKLEAGESSKSVEAAATLWEELLEAGADRQTVLVAAGGGVIGDLAGFVAATFARGLDFVQVPTTLLAHVDSSVGGKVGVNLPAAKNMVGAFWQPRLVLIDTDVLSTLPEREFRSGLAEVVKYGVIQDAAFFSYLEQHVQQILNRDPATLRFVIARCCRLKADVVEQDECETTGLRAILNYGHTFAHAFEATLGYGQMLHGEAVSVGMMCAARLAELLGRIGSELIVRQAQLLTELGLPTAVPDLPSPQLVAAMQHDKKVQHGQLRFVLPDRLGHVDLVSNVDESLVIQALEF